MLLTWLPAYRPPVTRPLTRKHRDECRAAPDRHGSCPSSQRRLPYGTAPAIQLPARRHIYRHRSRPAFGPRTLDNRPDRVPPVSARYPYRSEEHTTELQSLMRTTYDVFRLKKK